MSFSIIKRSLFSLFLLGTTIALTSCSDSMDEFIEDMSEQEEVVPFYVDTLTVAHWNIGHFALGKSGDSTISSEDSEYMASMYRGLLDSVNADIIGICEYSPSFSVNGEKTSSFVFDDYLYNCIGAKYSYNCSAIFSRAKLNDNKVVFFEKCIQQRYYIVSKLLINDKDVLFVETHLDWNQGKEGEDCRATQIQKLIDEFRNYPYVIICADFNVSDINEFQPFVAAGFSLANGGELGIFSTYPASNPTSPIDNIITKGFSILSIEVMGDKRLSDHCIVKSSILLNV